MLIPGTSIRNGKTSLHPWDGVTEANYTGPRTALQTAGREQGVLVAEGAAMEGQCRWKWARWRACWWAIASGRSRSIKEVVNAALGKLKVGPGGAVLHAGTHGGARSGNPVGGALAAGRVQQPDRESERPAIPATADTQFWEPETWKPESKGFGFTEAPRGSLGHWIHIKDREDRQLPDRGAEHLERFAEGRQGAARGLRGGADRHTDGGSQAAGGDPAHHPLVRPVPGVRVARHSARTARSWWK